MILEKIAAKTIERIEEKKKQIGALPKDAILDLVKNA